MTYIDYIQEIEERRGQGLHPKPIDASGLLSEIIDQIKDKNNEDREDSLLFLLYNTLPGTTAAAGVKAKFLKEIILGESKVEEISTAFALEQMYSCFSRHCKRDSIYRTLIPKLF